MKIVCPHCGGSFDDSPVRTRPVSARQMQKLIEGQARPSEPPTDPQGRIDFPTKELPTDPTHIIARARRWRTAVAVFVFVASVLIFWLTIAVLTSRW